MKDTKTEFRLFTVPEWEKEQDYLRQKHKMGWKLVKVSGLCMFHFVRCQPEDVVYQLDYNQEGISHKEQYVQMFRDCGWEYLQDYVGYSYFRKPAAQMQENEAIFCDDASRMDMIKRVFTGRMIPLLVLFLFLLIPNFMTMILMDNWVLVWIYAVLLGLYGVVFLKFAVLFLRLWKSANQ